MIFFICCGINGVGVMVVGATAVGLVDGAKAVSLIDGATAVGSMDGATAAVGLMVDGATAVGLVIGGATVGLMIGGATVGAMGVGDGEGAAISWQSCSGKFELLFVFLGEKNLLTASASHRFFLKLIFSLSFNGLLFFLTFASITFPTDFRDRGQEGIWAPCHFPSVRHALQGFGLSLPPSSAT